MSGLREIRLPSSDLHEHAASLRERAMALRESPSRNTNEIVNVLIVGYEVAAALNEIASAAHAAAGIYEDRGPR